MALAVTFSLAMPMPAPAADNIFVGAPGVPGETVTQNILYGGSSDPRDLDPTFFNGSAFTLQAAKNIEFFQVASNTTGASITLAAGKDILLDSAGGATPVGLTIVGDATLIADDDSRAAAPSTHAKDSDGDGEIQLDEGPVVIVGSTTLISGPNLIQGANLPPYSARDNISATNVGNDFGGTVNASANNISLVDANSIVLGDIDADANITITANGGSITDDGTPGGAVAGSDINVLGTTSLYSTNGITLNDELNDFGGAVTATTTGDIVLADVDDIILGNITATNLTVTATDLKTSNPSVTPSVAATINATDSFTFNKTGSGNVVFSQNEFANTTTNNLIINNLSGDIEIGAFPPDPNQIDKLTLNAGSTGTVKFTGSGTHNIGSLDIVNAKSVNQSTEIAVTGNTSLGSGTNGISGDIVLNDAYNYLGGTVTAIASGDIDLVNVTDTTLGNIAGTNVTVTAPDIDLAGTSIGATSFTFINSAADTVQVGGTASAVAGTFDLTAAELGNLSTSSLKIDSKGGAINVDSVSLDPDSIPKLVLDGGTTGAVIFGGTSVAADNLEVANSASISQTSASSGALAINKATTLNAVGNINLTNSNNSLGDTITASGVDVTLTNGGGINLGDVDVTGNLTLTAGSGSITDDGTPSGAAAGSDVDVTGTTSLSATGDITLNDEYNNFGGAIDASTSSSGSITLFDIDDINLGNIDAGGNLTIVSAGSITDNGDGGADGDDIDTGGPTSLSAATGITLDDRFNVFRGAVSASTTSGDIILHDAFDMELGNISAENLTVTATDINISGTSISAANGVTFINSAGDGVLIGDGAVADTSAFDLSINNLGTITTSNLTFDSKNGAISLVDLLIASVPIDKITLRAGTGAVSFDGSSGGTALKAIDVASSSSISQTFSINIEGSTTLTSTGNIDLSEYGNRFGSTIAASAENISLTSDSGSLLLGDVDASGALSLSATGGSISNDSSTSVSGSLTAMDVDVVGATSLWALENINLFDSKNNFGGAVSAGTSSGDITLNDIDSIVLGDIDANGNLTVTANIPTDYSKSGSITDDGSLSGATLASDIDVAGTTSLGAYQDIILDDAFNNFRGKIDANSLSGSVVLNDVDDIILGDIDAPAGLTVTAGGSITDDGAGNSIGADINTSFGTTSLSAATGITLDDSGTDFEGVVSASTSSGSIILHDVDGITLGNVSGTNLSLTATDVSISSSVSTGVSLSGFLSIYNTGNDLVTIGDSSDIDEATFEIAQGDLDKIAVSALFINSNGGNIQFQPTDASSSGKIDNFSVNAAGTGSSAGDVTFGGSGPSSFENFTVSRSNSISQTNSISVIGTTSLSADTTITMANTGNDFGGAVSAFGTNVSLVDSNSIILGDIDAGTNLTVSALGGSITDNGDGSASGDDINVSGTTSLSATGDITLDDAFNDFDGEVSFSGANVTLVDTDNISLGNSSASGNLSIAATGQIVGGTNTITVTGTTSLSAGASSFVAFANIGNDFGSTVTASAGGVHINDKNDLILGDITALNELVMYVNNSIEMRGTVQASGTSISATGSSTNVESGGVFDIQNASTADRVAITGDFNLKSGGKLQVDVDSSAGTADLISVTGATTLAGTIDVNLLTTKLDSQTNIITSSSGVTDNGATIGTVTGLANPSAKVTLGYPDSNNVTVNVGLSAVLLDGNINQDGVVNAVNNGAAPEVLAALLGLPSNEETIKELSKLYPEIIANQNSASWQSTLEALNNLFSCQVAGEKYSVVSEGNCWWLRPEGRYLERDATSSNAGLTERAGGVSMGIQSEVAESWFAGFSLGFERTNISNTAGANTDGDRYHAGGVLKYQKDQWVTSMGVIGGFGQYKNTRTNLLGTNFSEQDVRYIGAQFRTAYLYEMEEFYAKPMLDLSITRIFSDGFSETGTAATALTVADSFETYYSINPSFELGREWQTENDRTIRAFARFGANFQPDNNTSVTSSFSNGSSTAPQFQTQSEGDEFSAELELGITFFQTEGTSIQLGYQGSFSENSRQHGGFLKATFEF